MTKFHCLIASTSQKYWAICVLQLFVNQAVMKDHFLTSNCSNINFSWKLDASRCKQIVYEFLYKEEGAFLENI